MTKPIRICKKKAKQGKINIFLDPSHCIAFIVR